VTSAALAYNGLGIDRALGRRGDPAWIQAVLGGPVSRVIPFWREQGIKSDRG
jgi:hypothetical protein